ncbi:hypothetical protein C5167_015167 [Papaver somniferum]|uniref:Uncharacterized protein n=1 Tax=Papaver somniferum TaxID=3469 RepID=A0A4Y7J9B4_PAPSO|nr:hypothetical protein C5167_015167 [Papaver somniferum]
MNFTEKKCRNWKRDQENTSLMSTQMRLMLIQGFVYLERRNPGYYETRHSVNQERLETTFKALPVPQGLFSYSMGAYPAVQNVWPAGYASQPHAWNQASTCTETTMEHWIHSTGGNS